MAAGRIGPVEIVKLEEWSNQESGRSGRNVHYRVPGGETEALPLAASVNGAAPVPGETGELLIETYIWHDAAISRAGRPFATRRTKVRVCGFQASLGALAEAA